MIGKKCEPNIDHRYAGPNTLRIITTTGIQEHCHSPTTNCSQVGLATTAFNSGRLWKLSHKGQSRRLSESRTGAIESRALGAFKALPWKFLSIRPLRLPTAFTMSAPQVALRITCMICSSKHINSTLRYSTPWTLWRTGLYSRIFNAWKPF